MDSKFFEEVEFEIEKSPADPRPKTIVVWDPEKLKAALAEIEEELTKVRGGASEYVPRAIDPGKFGFPAQNAIKMFVRDPSDKGLKDVTAIAKQDWGARMGAHVTTLLKDARSEKINE